jgi:hypothetical protein
MEPPKVGLESLRKLQLHKRIERNDSLLTSPADVLASRTWHSRGYSS